MTMMWVGIGSAAVGVAGNVYNANHQPSAPGAPAALPSPTTPGGFNTDTGYGYTDANGTYQQGGYNFDPYSQQQQLDSQAAYNSFMGRPSTGITDQIDAQIAALNAKLQNVNKSASGSTAAAGVDPGKLGAWLNPKTGKAYTPAEISNVAALKTNDNPLYQTFWSQDRKGESFEGWLQKAYTAAKPDLDAYEKDAKTQTGNAGIAGQSAGDIQRQIDYLTKQRQTYSPTNPDGTPNKDYVDPKSTDPFAKFQSDLGAKWAGNMNNVNQFTGDQTALTKQKMDQANMTPDEYMKKYMGDYANPQYQQDQIAAFKKQLGGVTNIPVQEITAGHLDPNAAGAQEAAANWQAGRDAQGQQQALRQRLGARGMSAMGELAAFSQGQNLTGQQLTNHNNAAMMGNDIATKNFGMEAQAAGANNSARLGAAGLGLQGLQMGQTAQNQGMSDALSRANLANGLQSNWFTQAQQALGLSNSMAATDRANNLQDYNIAQQANKDQYGRTNDTYNRLTTASQQAFQNQMAKSGLLNQTTGILGPMQSGQANAQNQANVANAQMNNAYNMSQQQQAAARQNATVGGITGALGSAVNAYGQYQGANPSTGTPGSAGTQTDFSGMGHYDPVTGTWK